MWTICTNILGFPDETRDQMMDTVRFSVACGTDFAVFYPLLHLPKTKVYEDAHKEGRMDYEAFAKAELAHRHGAKILVEAQGVDELAVNVSFGHHLRYDRQGYPPVSGEVELDPVTQLVNVVDVYEAVTANEASEAMELLERTSPSVILLDLLMPRMTGLALYRRITSHPRIAGIPIVILSGLSARADLPGVFAREGRALPPPAAFIDKPVDIEEILLMIDELTASTRKELPS